MTDQHTKEDFVNNAFGSLSADVETHQPSATSAVEAAEEYSGTIYQAHIHGPDCRHSHTEMPEKFKYDRVADIPLLDVPATFATNSGPNWAPNTRKAVEKIVARLKDVPDGEVIVLMVHYKFYAWLITYNGVLRHFKPSKPDQVTTSGVMGMWGPKCIVVCDMPLNLELTAPNAFYFCEEVLANTGKTDEVRANSSPE